MEAADVITTILKIGGGTVVTVMLFLLVLLHIIQSREKKPEKWR
jgi:hypothetical protein